MKKILKITIILIIILTTLGQASCVMAATDWNTYKPGDDTQIYNDIKPKAEIVLGIIRAVGMVVSVIVLMILGIKEMTASVEEKSIIKQAMPGYIIGAVLVFAITWLPTLIYNIVNGE